jgi:uncharacterized membrane protein YhaH (DUF805 family)
VEKARKSLKELSVLVLAFAAYSLIRVVLGAIFTDFDASVLPEGTTEGMFTVGKIVLCAISLILLLPQIYVGVKGLKVSKNPDNSKGHITWATVLAVISVIGVISSAYNLIQAGEIVNDILEMADMLIDVALFGFYVKYAKQILKGE